MNKPKLTFIFNATKLIKLLGMKILPKIAIKERSKAYS